MLRKLSLGLLSALILASCQGLPTRSPQLSISQPAGVAPQNDQGQVAINIRWPYRAQVVPTSTQRLHFVLSGPSPLTLDVDRPTGTAPLSTASFAVNAGTGYSLSAQALAYPTPGALTPTLVVASGQSASFNVLANKLTALTLSLNPAIAPSLTSFTPNNGGPGVIVTLSGTNLGASRSLTPTILFGSALATVVSTIDDQTARAAVPAGATSGALTPIVDGVTGSATGSFTVLAALGLQPSAQSIASGSTAAFTASATASGGGSFPSPTVQWYLSTSSIGVISQGGTFTSNGSTGSAVVQVYSGSLLATASVTVTFP